MYEYKNVKVDANIKFSSKQGEIIDQCMQQINEHAKQGWRLVQIVTPINEKSWLTPYGYEIIFEREIN